MKCNEVLQHLNEYIENDLDGRLMDEIREHIEECSECRKIYKEEKILNDMFLEALNSEPIEFNSRIGNIMNMIDKDKYSSQKEGNEVIESAEDSKVIKLESVNKKKQKKFIFNKRIIAVAATFTIMVFMAPFIIGEQKKDMDYASENDMKISSFDQLQNDSEKDYNMASNKGNEKSGYSVSVQNSEEENEETNEANSKEEVAAVQASDEQTYNNENSEQESKVKVSLLNSDHINFKTRNASDNNVEYLKKEHKIIFGNEESKTTIKINNQEEDLGIIDGKITDVVKDDEYVYIACVGIDTEKGSLISKILKVNSTTNKVDTIYTSLNQEAVMKLDLQEEKINYTTVTIEGQEKEQFMEK